jgi:hypothetical protein
MKTEYTKKGMFILQLSMIRFTHYKEKANCGSIVVPKKKATTTF